MGWGYAPIGWSDENPTPLSPWRHPRLVFDVYARALAARRIFLASPLQWLHTASLLTAVTIGCAVISRYLATRRQLFDAPIKSRRTPVAVTTNDNRVAATVKRSEFLLNESKILLCRRPVWKWIDIHENKIHVQRNTESVQCPSKK